jgi:hypothetical protein
MLQKVNGKIDHAVHTAARLGHRHVVAKLRHVDIDHKLVVCHWL